ncbi:MAG: Ig-like domain-containing protein [Anaerolineae bacterium]
MIKKTLLALALACLALMLGAPVAGAQDSTLQILLSRSMGFSLGNQIQGSFTISVADPAGLTAVTYLIDGKEMSTVTQAPFRYSFSTDSYTVGPHQFSATAQTAGGLKLTSNMIDVEIVTPSAGLQSTTRILIPVFGVVLLIIVVMVALQVMPIGRNKRRFAQGGAASYGPAGGAICPRCGRPFARSVLALNLITGKLERCPYCGKWSITRPVSIEALHAAEQAEVQGAKPAIPELTPEERLRQQIEDSKLSN